MKRSTQLPPFALEYVAVHSSRRMVEWFHLWMKRSGRSILQVEWRDIASALDQFLAATCRSPVAKRTRRRQLFRYFEWLHERNLLSFDPKLVQARTGFQLPSEAERFVKSLEPTHKVTTTNGYRSSLRQFHLWLQSQRIEINAIERAQISTWLEWINARGMSATQRLHQIQQVRMYFRWLEEQPSFTGQSADHLFRKGDLPKLPQYLPRPIPADVDRILQRRLRKSHSPLQLGLLLMRRTGLRIGELRTLPLKCVHNDHRGRHFLKVPLGKLNNERLVPLDQATLRLIAKLRRSVGSSTCRRGRRRRFLLESPSGKPISYTHYNEALSAACRGLVFAERMTSHRLRHTYATSMLVGGVSLPALMKLLGHRDYRMTLRYAAMTVETVADEYADAVERIEQRYNLRNSDDASSSPDLSLTNLSRFLLKQVEDAGGDKQAARALIQRLNRLDIAVQRLLRDCRRIRR